MNSVSFSSHAYPAQALPKPKVRFAGNSGNATQAPPASKPAPVKQPEKPSFLKSQWHRFTRLFRDIKKTIVHFFSNPEKTETEIQLKELKNNLRAILDENSYTNAHKAASKRLQDLADSGLDLRKYLKEHTAANQSDEARRKWQTEKSIPNTVDSIKQLNDFLAAVKDKNVLQPLVTLAPQYSTARKRVADDIAKAVGDNLPATRKWLTENLPKSEFQKKVIEWKNQPDVALFLPWALMLPEAQAGVLTLRKDSALQKTVTRVLKDKNASQEFKDLLKELSGQAG